MTNGRHILVFPEPADVARKAAELFCDIGRGAVVNRRCFNVCLAGGSTPKAAYTLLAEEYGNSLFWELVNVFFGDERNVPPDHADSNYRMAREAFLDRLPFATGRIHRIPAELGAEKAAQDYEAVLRRELGEKEARFDLVLLGIGNDGHTASLFPYTKLLHIDDNPCAAEYVESVHSERISLTFPILNSARHIVVLATGEGKTEILKTVFSSAEDVERYPVQGLKPADGQVTWLIDKAAAGRLFESGIGLDVITAEDPGGKTALEREN